MKKIEHLQKGTKCKSPLFGQFWLSEFHHKSVKWYIIQYQTGLQAGGIFKETLLMKCWDSFRKRAYR